MPPIEEASSAQPTTRSEHSCHDLPDGTCDGTVQAANRDQVSLLTLLPECELTDQAKDHMDSLGVREMYAEVSTKEDVDAVVGEAT